MPPVAATSEWMIGCEASTGAGEKNCELGDGDITRICDAYLAFKESAQSKIFPNQAFGYWKVTVERPLRAKGIDQERVYSAKEIKALREEGLLSPDGAQIIRKIYKPGTEPDPLHGRFPVSLAGSDAELQPCI